jgi:hypothetical protein
MLPRLNNFDRTLVAINVPVHEIRTNVAGRATKFGIQTSKPDGSAAIYPTRQPLQD